MIDLCDHSSSSRDLKVHLVQEESEARRLVQIHVFIELVFVRQDFILFKQSHRREKREHFLLSIQSNVQTDRLAVF